MEERAVEDEAALMARAGAGDREGLGRLYDRHHGPLFGFFYNLTGCREASSDLVHDVFLRVLRYAHSFQAGAPFRPWLYRIARNVLSDRRGPAGVEDLDEGLPCPEPGPEVRMADLADTWAALGQLPWEAPAPGLRARVVGHRFPWRWAGAAAALLAVGFGAGWMLRPEVPMDPERVRQQRVLRLLRDPSVSERATGLALLSGSDTAPELLGALLERVARDPSPALRREAAEALALFAGRLELRERMVAQLAKERDPQVQLALVDLLGACREQAARRALKRLLEAGALQEPARSRAQQLL